MNKFAAVTEGVLRKSLGVTAAPCPFGPGVAIAVQRNAFNFEQLASPVKLRRAGVAVRSADLREEGSLSGQFLEQHRQAIADSQTSPFAGLLPFVSQQPALPIDVFHL
jgi:hypothetical protein